MGHCLSLSSSEDSCESDRSEDVPVEKLVEKTKQWGLEGKSGEAGGRMAGKVPGGGGVGGDLVQTYRWSPGDGMSSSALSQLGALHS